jgi:hypothetical protein
MPGRHSVARELLRQHLHSKDRLARDLLDAQVHRPLDRAQDAGDLPRLRREEIEVVPEQFHGHIGADAGDHLVDAHLDRLSERAPLPRHVAKLLLDQVDELVLSPRALPEAARLGAMKDIRQLDPMGSVATSALPDPAQTRSTSSGKAEDGLLHERVVAHGLPQVRCRRGG